MRIRELSITNFRKFRGPTRLAGFDDGLNLVCEPNETGKSTVLEALRAVLFERHGSKSERIQSFRPQGDEVAPEVELAFEVGGQSWKIRKRFIQRPEAVLEGPHGRASGDEAEDQLQSLLGFTKAGNRGADAESRGALGLLWVEQGQSFHFGAPGQAARRTLEDVLAGEVGAVTGGRRTGAVAGAVEKGLGELLTATGRPTGRLLRAHQAAEAAQAEATEAAEELQQYEAVLDRLESKRNELRRLQRDLTDPELEAQLAELSRDVDRAKAAGQSLRTADVLLQEATGVRERLEQRLAAREALREELQRVEDELSSVRSEVAAHQARLATARVHAGASEAALEAAREALREADERRKQAVATRAADDRRRSLSAAFSRLEAAEAIARDLQAARSALAAATMTDERLAELEALEQECLQARAAATAGAATLSVTLEPGAPSTRLNGVALGERIEVAVTETQRLELQGVGVVNVQPPAGGEAAQRKLSAAEQDLGAFLAQVGFSSAAEARAAARSRVQVEQRAEGLAARLDAACPADHALGIGAGLDALRGALAAEAPPPATEVDPTAIEAGDVEAAWETARTAERDAEGRRQGTLEALHEAEREEVRLGGRVERVKGEHDRLAADLAADLASASDEALSNELAAFKSAEARAIVDRDEARRAAEGLDEAQLVRKREALVTRRERMHEDRLDLVGEVAKLEERAKTLGGAGPASRAATAQEAAVASKSALARLEEEAEVLRLLQRVIQDAQLEASRRYLAPVTQRVSPFVSRLLPNASIAFGDDYTPQLLIRGGREEAAEQLSKGTQEQLAVLTRIAFADLLIAKGKPASLVLDDALVFADDDRFETMLEILSEAARRMQVVILSCRTSAYRGLPAQRISIT